MYIYVYKLYLPDLIRTTKKLNKKITRESLNRENYFDYMIHSNNSTTNPLILMIFRTEQELKKNYKQAKTK